MKIILLGFISLFTLTGCLESAPTKVIDSLIAAGCEIKTYNQRNEESIKISCYESAEF